MSQQIVSCVQLTCTSLHGLTITCIVHLKQAERNTIIFHTCTFQYLDDSGKFTRHGETMALPVYHQLNYILLHGQRTIPYLFGQHQLGFRRSDFTNKNEEFDKPHMK
jgi:hypothetical protein